MKNRSTVRLDEGVQEALARLSKISGKTKNRLINEAVASYVKDQALAMAHEADALHQALKAYQTKDPDFEAAIDRFVEAEADSKTDPAEGTVDPTSESLTAHVQHLVDA
ncbi:MAG: hypothetical protein E1N59_588 [Puniceicoccaceae bacterium 5H]|nr:MAG: hypothetical protein E1N59_588 [Puniceicoccaceae bacterium 5H]